VSDSSAGWVTIALLGRTRGNRGEITAQAFSSKPERYQSLKEVTLWGGSLAGPTRFEVESTWFHGGVLIFKFRGVDTISDGDRLAGVEVRVPLAERAPLDPDEFFESDLLGCDVFDRGTGTPLGKVTAWKEGGGSGLLEIDGDWLLPFVRSICVEIDPSRKRIAVELPEGLKDLNRP
jgi:16S rRNA processing protein RimM